jgi:hypothetical protein
LSRRERPIALFTVFVREQEITSDSKAEQFSQRSILDFSHKEDTV